MEGVADSAVFGVPSLTSTAVCTAVAVCVARVRACDDASNSSMEGVPLALSRSPQGRGWTFFCSRRGGSLSSGHRLILVQLKGAPPRESPRALRQCGQRLLELVRVPAVMTLPLLHDAVSPPLVRS